MQCRIASANTSSRRRRLSRTPWNRSSEISARRFAAKGSGSGSDPRARCPPPWPLGAVAAALALLILTPSDAWAWTPGTHIFLGDAVLRSLTLIPGSLAELLHAFPYDFLYGSIAADTSIAKKYAPAGRHCHAWNVGLEIYERARTEALRAFGLGYLAHLAADVVAHNYFVPHQLAVTSSSVAIGHSYWESRFETHLGERFSRRAREIILLDHARSDEHLDRILSPTIFSTQTNRRIFRGMVYVTDTESWQRIFQIAAEKSRWDLSEPAVEQYLIHAYDYIVDFLNHVERSAPYDQDPAGDERLRLAKRVRRDALRLGGEPLVTEEARRWFGLPDRVLGYATRLDVPLYVPARVTSN